MKISYNWLKEFIDLDLSPEETAEKLTLIGLEVDELTTFGSSLEGVVVGEVLEVVDHPNADRLRICRVNVGSGDPVQIICGADNVATQQKVPVATVGTSLPLETDEGNPLVIRKTSIRGENSNGMICSERELGLSDDHSGIMVLDEKAKVGQALNSVIDLYEDSIFDIEITPNRPDSTCHLGVARDLSAALDLNLKKPFSTKFDPAVPLEDHIAIEIQNPEKCPRYVGKVVKEVNIKESPSWLKNRLRAIGVRPVNNVVDATNYVLYELGQPLHAFDLDSLAGPKIVVKDYENEVEFESLDHIKRTCSPGTLFICDADEPVAIAGVMGGVDSEVSDETRNILIESAYFNPGDIRKTAKEQNLQTDASYRFERGIDPNLQRIAAERAAELIADLTEGSIVEGCTDVHPIKFDPANVTLRTSRTNMLLGTDFTEDEIKNIVKGLEFEVVEEAEGALTFKMPSFRPDLKREVDLIEEVGRLYDYNNIPTPEHVKFIAPESLSDWEQLLTSVKEKVKALHFREIYTNSLMPEKDAALFGDLEHMIHTLNPISQDMTTLRPTLRYGFLKSAAYNFNRKVNGVRFFEIGNIFRESEEGSWFEHIHEATHLLMGIAGLKTEEHWKTDPEPYDLFDLKGPVQALLEQLGFKGHLNTVQKERILQYRVKDADIGTLRAVEPDLLEEFEIDYPAFIAEFSLQNIQQALNSIPERRYRPVSKYPGFEFDFAVVVDSEVPAGELLGAIEQEAGDILKNLQVFDVFEGESLGEGKKSLAFRCHFLDRNKTLTIKDVEPIINKVLKVLERRFSAKLRS